MSHRERDYDQPQQQRNRGSSSRDEYRSRDRHRDSRGYRDDRYHQNREDSGGRRPLSYDAEYESRKFRDRRDRQHGSSRRSRSRDRHYNEDHSRRGDSRRETSSYYSEDSENEAKKQQQQQQNRRPREDATEKRQEDKRDNSDSSSSSDSPQKKAQQNKEESEYLAKLSDAKLQETYDRYEADPNFDITDGLLDNIVIDKEKIHTEMQERLRQHLLAEGKIYPAPKPEPRQQTTIFANDGSFMDMFKKMQEQQQEEGVAGASGSAVPAEAQAKKPTEVKPRPQAPMYGKRRGGKILKTGIVEKKKPIEDVGADAAPGDAWSQYMKEVKRYKSVSCDVDNKTRPLVK